jgi:hypothetical protein
LILKFYEIEGRFPAYPEEIPPAAVEYVASLVKVEAGLLAKYSWRRPSVVERRALGVARRAAGQSVECAPAVGDQQ